MRAIRRIKASWLMVIALAGCQTPTARIEHFAAAHDLETATVTGDRFHHIVIRNGRPVGHATLHVYIEGDGTPFVNPITVAVDPTPRKPLMLHLMSFDPHRAVYVGRPCYLGLRFDENCNAEYWTLRRFSVEVVASMAAVIRAEMVRAGATSVELFGHSGGGALAILLTRELPETSAMVTIAGNLDSNAWARLHGYTPLEGSLNPADVVLSPALALHSEHYVGSADDALPPSLIRAAAMTIGGSVREIPGYTHQCCWETLWPAVLAQHTTD